MTPDLLERTAEDKLDLRVDAAQVVVGPPLHRVEKIAIDAKQKRFALGHQVRLLVDRTGIQHGLDIVV